ncbi:MAG: DUF4031 domain-containing protein [Gammaproteobacteria bacterium]|nr:DUF4031 domain-containing protein [Gammaproteobacteria bacterium]
MILTDGIHLATTGTIEELHNFATKIGLKKEWFQNHRRPHYDLTTARMAAAAERAGATRVNTKVLVKMLQLKDSATFEGAATAIALDIAAHINSAQFDAIIMAILSSTHSLSKTLYYKDGFGNFVLPGFLKIAIQNRIKHYLKRVLPPVLEELNEAKSSDKLIDILFPWMNQEMEKTKCSES